jgi:hydrogenase maturation protein HypF
VENPIVIVPALDGSFLSREVAPGLSSVGLMLPTTPLHALLVRECGRPLVVTSGNIDGEPLAADPEGAVRDLACIADLFVHHDRPIAHPVDDSVVRVMAGRSVTIRLARGLAPLPLPGDGTMPGLAVGGHQKVAIALCNGWQSALGPHLGDLDLLEMRERFERHVAEMLALYDCKPKFLVGDQHPDYCTSRWLGSFDVPQVVVGESGIDVQPPAPGKVFPQRSDLSLGRLLSEVRHVVRVQHHHAHIAAGMLEHGWQDRGEVLGVAFDGTGYGPDGTIWGGEFLLCTLTSFRRVARLRPFWLPGGERAIREPWRIALSLLADAVRPSELSDACFKLLPEGVPWRRLLALSAPQDVRACVDDSGRSAFGRAISGLSPMTSSAGRLFDGIAGLVLQIGKSSYEGLPAIRLEDACDESEPGRYEFTLQEGDPIELDWRPVVRQVVDDLRDDVSAGQIAMRFHRGLAAAVALISDRFPQHPVVLGGGVFQNRVLVEQIADAVPGARLGLPGRIPPNDGGLAAGQLAIAARVLEEVHKS